MPYHPKTGSTDMTLSIGKNARIHSSVSMVHTEENVISIGDNANFYQGTQILGPVTIEDDVFINREAYIRPHTVIERNVRVGPFVRLITDTHDVGPSSKRAGAVRNDPIRVGAGTWLGASVSVLAGVTIGKGCIVAAGAVVTADVPDDTLVGGYPPK